VVHSGGIPDGVGVGNKYVRLHFYLPTRTQKPAPLGETIYRRGLDKVSYFVNHWHSDKAAKLIQDAAVQKVKSTTTNLNITSTKVEITDCMNKDSNLLNLVAIM
jgi:hypothetical protein